MSATFKRFIPQEAQVRERPPATPATSATPRPENERVAEVATPKSNYAPDLTRIDAIRPSGEGASRTFESALPELPKGAIVEFEERASILEHDGGLTKTEAERAAAVALGFPTPDAFYTAVLATWRAKIENVRPATPHVKKLKEASLEILRGPLAMQAVRRGWCELSLFGVFDGNAEAARNRLGARGLLPALAWSSLNMKLDSINREYAFLITPTGAVLRQRRFQSEIELSTKWWRNRALLAEAAPNETLNLKGYYDEGY